MMGTGGLLTGAMEMMEERNHQKVNVRSREDERCDVRISL
jgi:hypothetical protein